MGIMKVLYPLPLDYIQNVENVSYEKRNVVFDSFSDLRSTFDFHLSKLMQFFVFLDKNIA